jgi:hypothetical protein
MSDADSPSSLLGIHHRACGVFISKSRVYAARSMYVIGKVEVEESISILRLEEPEVTFSTEEFDHYADLFEEMLERMEEAEGEERDDRRIQDESEWSYELDAFDLAEIAGMRERYGLTLEN